MDEKANQSADRKLVLRVARAIHLAKIKSCYFPDHDGWSGQKAALMREPWPENRKEAERLLQDGQSWMEIAIDQAKAALAEMAVSE